MYVINAMILSFHSEHLMDQLQGHGGILPDLPRQLWRQPQAAHGRGLRQQQTPGDLRHLGAEVESTAAPNAWGRPWEDPGKTLGRLGASKGWMRNP